jgi:hypothetical protein
MDLTRTLLDGMILTILASIYIIITLKYNPRIWLQDYPKDIQNMVPPKTGREKRLSLILGIPFIILLLGVPFLSTLAMGLRSRGDVGFIPLFVNAFSVTFVFNIIDWLVLDWLMFCTITPRFVVIPGTEGAAGYKNYFFHFRGFLIGTLLSIVGGLIIAGIVYLSRLMDLI